MSGYATLHECGRGTHHAIDGEPIYWTEDAVATTLVYVHNISMEIKA